MDPKENKYSFTYRYTIKPEQLGGFLDSLHRTQLDMIEQAVEIKQRQGFPEATEVLNDIMSRR